MASNRPWGNADKFSSSLIKFGFTQFKFDYNLFTCITPTSFAALLVNVDDIVFASNSVNSISLLKAFLNKYFKIKDLGSLRYFLGIEVARNLTGIHLC